MADIHVLTSSTDTSLAVVFHFPVADADNEVSVGYRAALVASGLGGATVLPDGDGTVGTIAAAEKTAIEAGEVFEHARTIPQFSAAAKTPAQMLSEIRAFYATDQATETAKIVAALRYYGYTAAKE